VDAGPTAVIKDPGWIAFGGCSFGFLYRRLIQIDAETWFPKKFATGAPQRTPLREAWQHHFHGFTAP